MKDEIKEISIFEASKMLFVEVLNIINYIFLFFIGKIWYFITIIIIGLIIGFSLHYFNKQYYKSELILSSNSVNSKELILLLNEWNWKNDSTIPPELKNEIKQITATYLLDLNNDSIWDVVEQPNQNSDNNVRILNQRMKSSIAVIVLTYKPETLDKLQKIIQDHISNNAQVAKINNFRIKRLKHTLDQINKEMAYIDSLHASKISRRNAIQESRISISYTPKNESEKDNLKLIKYKGSILFEMELKPDAISIIQSFNKPKEAVNSLKWYLTKAGQLSLVLAFVISVIVEIKQRRIT